MDFRDVVAIPWSALTVVLSNSDSHSFCDDSEVLQELVVLIARVYIFHG